MKALFMILFSGIILLQFFDSVDSQINQKSVGNVDFDACPPKHEKTGDILKRFFANPGFQDDRYRIGVDTLSFNELQFLTTKSDQAACDQLKELHPWSSDHYLISYYRYENIYIVVNAVKPPVIEGDKIYFSTGYSSIFFLDRNFRSIGAVSL